MKLLKVTLLTSSLVLLMPLSSNAGDEFYGKIESRPESKVGTWVIGGRQAVVTDNTPLEEDDGPLAVGACVEVEYEGNAVEKIESEEKYKCGK